MNENQQTQEHLFEIYARLSFYEFLLELHYSRLFRDIPNGHAEFADFRAGVLDAIQRGQHEVAPSPLDARAVSRMTQLAERFFQKVEGQMG